MIIHKTCNSSLRSYVEIPSHFIDCFLADCPPVYPLIFIWSYRKAQEGKAVSSDDLMKEFRLTSQDVNLAWRHWEKKGLVCISGENSDEVSFLDVYENRKAETVQDKKFSKHVTTRPVYPTEELACYREASPDVARLFARAERTMGKLLSYNDMSVIFGFHDWLRLPIDVIEFLFTYCDETEHRNLRYIEKCALDWADNGIESLEAAMFYVKSFDRNYRSILRYMGLGGKFPSASQRSYIDRWIGEWKMPLDVIFYCCDCNVDSLNEVKFSWVNKVLESWHKQGVKNLEEAKLARESFSDKEKSKRQSKPAAPKVNRFVNFKQREYDWEALEKKERAYQDKVYGFSYKDGKLMVANNA